MADSVAVRERENRGGPTAAQRQRVKEAERRGEKRGEKRGFGQGVDYGRATFPAPPPEMRVAPGPAPSGTPTTEHQGLFSRSRTVGDVESRSERKTREKLEKLNVKATRANVRERQQEVAQKTGFRGWLGRRYEGAEHRRNKSEQKARIESARQQAKLQKVALRGEREKFATTKAQEKNARLQAKIERVQLKSQLKEAKREAKEAEERIRNREKERNKAEKARKKATKGPGLFDRVFHRESRSIRTGIRKHRNGRVSFVSRHSQHYRVREK